MNNTSIIVGAVIIAAALLFAMRWQITGSAPLIYRLDRWTGTVIGTSQRSPPDAS